MHRFRLIALTACFRAYFDNLSAATVWAGWCHCRGLSGRNVHFVHIAVWGLAPRTCRNSSNPLSYFTYHNWSCHKRTQFSQMVVAVAEVLGRTRKPTYAGAPPSKIPLKRFFCTVAWARKRFSRRGCGFCNSHGDITKSTAAQAFKTYARASTRQVLAELVSLNWAIYRRPPGSENTHQTSVSAMRSVGHRNSTPGVAKGFMDERNGLQRCRQQFAGAPHTSHWQAHRLAVPLWLQRSFFAPTPVGRLRKKQSARHQSLVLDQ